MTEKNIIALNRIVYPSVSLPDFIKLSSELGIHKIELRNDLKQKDILDSYLPERIKNTFEEEQVKVISINALQNFNITGLIEPLGFPTSSLRSILLTQKLIKESGFRTYKIVHNTFHFFLGPDNKQDLLTAYDKSLIGLVHISSAARSTPITDMKDEDRVLPDMVNKQDALNSGEQVKALADIGYNGDISFEAFSNRVQRLSPEDFKKHINDSIDLLFD